MMSPAARFVLALSLALALGASVLQPIVSGQESDTVPLKLLAINDLHGGIDTGRRVGNRPVGGAAYLAAHLKEHAAGHPNVRIVGAGDMVGASPPISGLLRDEPTVRVLNELGLLVNAPGNHEFDKGIDEFLRLRDGGCHPDTGCFEGARYKQISANIVVEATGEPLLPPFHVELVDGVRVAFIGATHSEVRSIVVPGAVDGLLFPTPAVEINRYVQQLKADGIKAIVVLIHEGGMLDRASGRLTGPITKTVEDLDPEVDVVVSSHTHQGYATRHAGKLVTQGFSYSSAFVDLDIALDRASGDVVDAKADVVTTFDDEVEPDAAVQAIVAEAEAIVAPKINRVVGRAASALTSDQNAAGESALGNLIADAQRWRMGTDFAMMNPGGIRAPLDAGVVTWGKLFSIQPFSNDLTTMTLSGEQLYTLFNQQWTIQQDGSEYYRPLQVSGLRVTWSAQRPMGDRVVQLALPDGQPIDRAARYSLTVNSFMAGGGDSFAVLPEGSDRVTGPVDVDALVEYVEQLPQPFSAAIEGRITRVE